MPKFVEGLVYFQNSDLLYLLVDEFVLKNFKESSLDIHNFSGSFEITGSKLIGLNDSGYSRSLPGFNIIIISDIFHCTGKYFNLRIA